ncbi:MAG: hypothetical protein JWM39_617 [Parcubacteria group bacterium]|nr:hypothetical protein [Parcubacteria group bacterium]
MKKDIDTTIRLCMSSLTAEEFLHGSTKDALDIGTDSTGRWRITGVYSQEYLYVLHCWTPHGNLIYAGQCGASLGYSVQPNLKNVLAMHQMLPIFLNGILEQFPALKERLEPYRLAAAVEF